MIALIGDYHLGVKNGNSVFHEYLTENFRITLKEIHQEGIKDIFLLGDFFDNRRSMPVNIIRWCMYDFPEMLKEYGMTAHILVGNHDTYYLTNNILTSVDIFKHVPNVKTYIDPEEIKIEDVSISMIPWINKTNIEETTKLLKNADKKGYVFGHFELNGFKMYANGASFEGGIDLHILKKFKHVYTGHFHHASTQGNISYIGSAFTLTRSDLFDIDQKGWYSLNLKTNKTKCFNGKESIFIEYDYVNSLDINSLDLKNKHVDINISDSIKINEAKLEQFKLDMSNSSILSVKYNDARILSKKISKDTKSKVQSGEIKTTRDFLIARIKESNLEGSVSEYVVQLHDRCFDKFELND